MVGGGRPCASAETFALRSAAAVTSAVTRRPMGRKRARWTGAIVGFSIRAIGPFFGVSTGRRKPPDNEFHVIRGGRMRQQRGQKPPSTEPADCQDRSCTT